MKIEYFRALGHSNGRRKYYYYNNRTQYVCALTPNQHTIKAMLGLAPLEYWENNYPSKRGVNWLAIFSAMMYECNNLGIYRSEAS